MPEIRTEDMITTAQFAQQIGGYSADTIKKYCQRQVIRGLRVGVSWMIPVSEIDRFQRERRSQGQRATG